ncbi:MAG: phage holin family protein [Candidatus Sedimenticola sp. (ex Thyasira tokunagai)]
MDDLTNTGEGLLTVYPWLAYWWVFGISAWGGIVSYIGKVRNGIISRFSFTELVGEMVTSAFVGLITFLICRAAGFNELVTAGCVGVTGHMGARAIFLAEQTLESWWKKRLEKRLGVVRQTDGEQS